MISISTWRITFSSICVASVGMDDTPVSRLAKILSDPANDDVNVALLSVYNESKMGLINMRICLHFYPTPTQSKEITREAL